MAVVVALEPHQMAVEQVQKTLKFQVMELQIKVAVVVDLDEPQQQAQMAVQVS
jgi:hypothetical protein